MKISHDKRKFNIRLDNGGVETVKGYACTLPCGHSGFIHNDGKGWVVSELFTGGKILDFHKGCSRKEALAIIWEVVTKRPEYTLDDAIKIVFFDIGREEVNK